MNLLLTSSSSWSSLATLGLTLEFLDGLEAEEEQRGRCGDCDEIFFIVSISLSFFLSLSLSRLIFNI